MTELDSRIEQLQERPELNEHRSETTKWMVRLTFLGQLGMHRTNLVHRPYDQVGLVDYYESHPALFTGTQLVPVCQESDDFDANTSLPLQWHGLGQICNAAEAPPDASIKDPEIIQSHRELIELGQAFHIITDDERVNPQFKMAFDIIRNTYDSHISVIGYLLKFAFHIDQWANIPKEDDPRRIADQISRQEYKDFTDYLQDAFRQLDHFTEKANTAQTSPFGKYLNIISGEQ